MNDKVFALVDCNNFYVSCERVFNPNLEGKPIIVMSSNDGCCVSRSNEAKALGIPMGVPLFKVKDIVKKHNIITFSSNFELYADMSWRVMQTLSNFCPEIEHYSIDEAFLHLNYASHNYQALGEKISQTVRKHTGIPVSVGIGPTKTLAKAANEISKNHPLLNGVLSFMEMSIKDREEYLKNLDIADVWGVGRQSTQKLRKLNINSAYALSTCNEKIIKKLMSVVGMRTVAELRGTSCIPLDDNTGAQKSIISSRSFGSYVTDLEDLKESVASHLDRGCTKLRKSGSVARYVTIYIRTNKFNKNHLQDRSFATQCLDVPSNYPPDFYEVTMPALSKIFRPGLKYAKAGIFLTDITPDHTIQQHLYESTKNNSIETKQIISSMMDAVRIKYGKNSIKFGSMGVRPNWYAKSSRLSNRYSTKLEEIIVAH